MVQPLQVQRARSRAPPPWCYQRLWPGLLLAALRALARRVVAVAMPVDRPPIRCRGQAARPVVHPALTAALAPSGQTAMPTCARARMAMTRPGPRMGAESMPTAVALWARARGTPTHHSFSPFRVAARPPRTRLRRAAHSALGPSRARTGGRRCRRTPLVCGRTPLASGSAVPPPACAARRQSRQRALLWRRAAVALACNPQRRPARCVLWLQSYRYQQGRPPPPPSLAARLPRPARAPSALPYPRAGGRAQLLPRGAPCRPLLQSRAPSPRCCSTALTSGLRARQPLARSRSRRVPWGSAARTLRRCSCSTRSGRCRPRRRLWRWSQAAQVAVQHMALWSGSRWRARASPAIVPAATPPPASLTCRLALWRPWVAVALAAWQRCCEPSTRPPRQLRGRRLKASLCGQRRPPTRLRLRGEAARRRPTSAGTPWASTTIPS